MCRTSDRRGWPALVTGLAVSASLALSGAALAQRGGDRGSDRGGDRGGSGRSESSHSSPAPQRDSGSRSSGPSRDSSPRWSGPSRDNGSSSRDYSTRRDSGGFGRDYSSPSRDYSQRSSGNGWPSGSSGRYSSGSSGSRDYGWGRSDSNSGRSGDATARGEFGQRYGSGRTEEPPFRRDYGQNRDSGSRDSGSRYDGGARRDTGSVDTGSRYGGGTRPDTGSRYDGTTRRDTPGRIDQGPRQDGTETHGRTARTHDDFRRDGYGDRSQPMRHDGGTFSGRAPERGSIGRAEDPRPYRSGANDLFARSGEGRRFNNGIYLRPRGAYSDPWIRPYFGSAFAYYPWYSPSWSVGLTFYSPYYSYYGVCPPYIYHSHCFYAPPPSIWIEFPIYSGGYARGWDYDGDDYYLSRGQYRDADPELDRAIDAIHDAFRTGSVEPLVNVTDPSVRVSVFNRGKYEYSLDPNDYLDMTRDMLHATDTIKFDLTRVHRRASNVYVASGKHEYRSKEGQIRTVYVSFVLERVGGRWVITQVASSPDRIQEPR